MYTIDFWYKTSSPHYDGKRHTITLPELDTDITTYVQDMGAVEGWDFFNIYDEKHNVTERVTTPPHYENGWSEIAVGCGVTEFCWSDRHAYEIVAIKSGSTMVVRELSTRRTDSNGMSDSQYYAYYHNFGGERKTLRKVKRGKGWCWIEWGKGGRSKGASTFGIGTAREFYDYTF